MSPLRSRGSADDTQAHAEEPGPADIAKVGRDGTPDDTEAHGVKYKVTDGVDEPGPDKTLRGKGGVTDEPGPDELGRIKF